MEKNLGHPLPTDGPYGEAWDLSSQKLHVSRVMEGPLAGRELSDLWANCHAALTGKEGTGPFPLLLKWLECRELLSLQVHPDDAMAQRVLNEPFGKSEAWVVVHAEPTARVYAGLKPGVTREDFVSHLNAGTLTECLHSFVPVAGDCISIPAGTVHSAGGGVVFAEVQQSSDATFRLFDWNRTGLDGKPRPLQIERALDAIDWNQGPNSPVVPVECGGGADGVLTEELVKGNGFHLERYTVQNAMTAPHSGEFSIWMILDGTAVLSQDRRGYQRRFHKGSTVVIPAGAQGIVWKPEVDRGSLKLLCIRLR